jgi:hypothetical protein
MNKKSINGFQFYEKLVKTIILTYNIAILVVKLVKLGNWQNVYQCFTKVKNYFSF